MNRRAFLHSLSAGALAMAARAAAPASSEPRVLVRSSWQIVNIGDIAHTPGLLALIEAHLPRAKVRLWASADLNEPVAAMLQRRFPGLVIVKGSIGADGRASTAALAEAVAWADFLLHGSGPSLVAWRDVAAFARHTGKPYGVYGITSTFPLATEAERSAFDGARFVFFRDSVSLEGARRHGVRSPLVAFAPDAAFACDLRNDGAAEAFLAAHGLRAGRFLCCIPKLRHTPYWTIRDTPRDERKHARNEAMKVTDHAPLVDAILAVVRQTDHSVLLCPEDATQMAVGRELLYDPLPAEVRSRVILRENFWLTDEALSTYRLSSGLFGHEQHSAIMCIGAGLPAIVCRWAEQTSKGMMWRDLGMGEWLFDMDLESDKAKVVPAVLALAQEPQSARHRAAGARTRVLRLQSETMAEVARHATSGPLETNPRIP